MNETSAVPSKVCAVCGERYPGDALFCPTDGRPLQSAAHVGREGIDPYLGQEISGHIEIRELIGVGAMGRVYRAFQRGIDRDVAVKILHRELSANAQLVTRFTREAKVASRLQHSNVVQVLLAGQLADRALYMVMEYLDGLSLQSALGASGAFALPRALHIALQLCDAVGEAHAQGIVHRDLKPENVMLVRRGADPDYVKVLDFGIARIDWGEQSVATAAGLIFGTARYISPEGAQGNAVTPASDVYSIGTLLFQMLAGRTPFDGDQAVGLLVQQIHDPAPALRSIPRAEYVPEPIADVVMASLAKDPAKREPDARALGQAIFDAAKIAGLSPEEYSSPLVHRSSSAIRMAPSTRTKQLELTPDIVARMTPSKGDVARSDLGSPNAATAKWEPPTEFHSRLAEVSREAFVSSSDDSSPVRPRLSSGVDATIDDMMVDPQLQSGLPQVTSPTPTSPTSTFPTPTFPTPSPSIRATSDDSRPDVPRTVPGDVEGPVRTQYTPPILATPMERPFETHPSARSEPTATPSSADGDGLHGELTRTRKWGLVVVCFLLGAVLAAAGAWKAGMIGGEVEEERYVLRATDAMFKNRFHEPPGDNVKDITDEGLRRWPNDRKLVDVRVRAANELTTQALAHRSTGDVLEALKLAKVAHDLDPRDPSAKRLVEQYESELANFSPSASPTLTKPPLLAAPPLPAPPSTKAASKPLPVVSTPPRDPRIDYKALVDVSNAAPRLGEPVDLLARVAPNKGDFSAPEFTVVGPGVPGGVRMPAQSEAPGVFKASYAFLEPGRFEITFGTRVEGRAISAKRSVVASAPPPPVKPPPPASTPLPTGSVKWM